jgi:hypothetical protein
LRAQASASWLARSLRSSTNRIENVFGGLVSPVAAKMAS